MAQYRLSMQVIKRSAGRSIVAAAAYRAGERLEDRRQGMVHDYANRTGVEYKAILIPDDAPIWVRGIGREDLWNAVDAGEKRRDAQTARELQLMIPRELKGLDRIKVVEDYLRLAFVSKGMIADVAWHCEKASDGLDNPHAHVLLTMRPLTATGFGPKSRHDMVPDPEGRTHPDGRPVLVESNGDSWNSVGYLEQCRKDWERVANAALERAGSDARIDHRSLLARGLSRLPEPALRLAYYLKDLHGVMKERFGQFQLARHYRSVEESAQKAFKRVASPHVCAAESASLHERFFGWFDRQLARLEPAPMREPPSPSMDIEGDR